MHLNCLKCDPSLHDSKLKPWNAIGRSSGREPEKSSSFEDTDSVTGPMPYVAQPITSQLVTHCFTPAGMSTRPITFPNLVTGCERNPEHIGRAALYTRYTTGEWANNCLQKYSEASANRNMSERMRNNTIRVLRETDEKASQGQRDAGRRLGERLTDITFWKNELNNELEKLISETHLLATYKTKLTKMIQDLESPLVIAQECLYYREGREEFEKVHDHPEKNLMQEVASYRANQENLRKAYDKVMNQLQEMRAIQYLLEDDIDHKEAALRIDSTCHQLNNFSQGINLYDGIEKYDPSISTLESWTQFSSNRVNKSQTERAKSIQIRSEVDVLINQSMNSVFECWNNTNSAIESRTQDLSDAKNKIQLHLYQVQQEIYDLERNMYLLRKSIQDKAQNLKVAQTRLEARNHRKDIEICKDSAQLRLIQEVHDLQDIISRLHRELQEAETQHQLLLKSRVDLEADLRRKVNALFIDQEKCMSIRRSFPVDTLIKF